MKTISIVIPVFREEQNLIPLYNELELVASQMSDKYNFEYVFVNDGSPDDSYNVLMSLSKLYKNVRVVDLSRNFGKEIALTAGLHEAKDFDALICIDADLQHPPKLIPTLIENWENGAEVVVTVRIESENQPLLRKIGSRLYYWIINKISDVEMVPQTTDFRLYDKKVTEVFKHATERERMFRGIMDWLGFRKVYVNFSAPDRLTGQAGYSYYKLWRLAVNSITSFSLWPLKLAGYLGGSLVLSILGAFIALIFTYLVRGIWIFSPLAIVVLANTFLIGIVLMCIGLVALYVGTIHTEVINRPLYVIREKINFE